jgi:hemolysin activation/secretion protein
MSCGPSCVRRAAGWTAGCFASGSVMLAASGTLAQQGPIPLPPAAAQIIQTPGASQITPPTFRPPLEKAPTVGPVVPTPPPVEAPPGAEKLFVQLGGLMVDGGFPELAAETRALEARLVSGRPVSGADLFAAASELEAAYARAGFVLARVVLPPQKLDDGSVLRLVVIDGYIERLETKNLPERVRDRVNAIVAPLVGQRRLNLREIERRLLLAGDIPGVVLRSTLAPGSATGAAVLALEANYQPVNGLLTLDNSLPTSIGTWTLGAGLDVSSVFGLGELFYLRVLGNPNGGDNGFFTANPLNRTLAGGVVLPLGSDGVTLNVEGTQARTAPISTIAGLQATSLFERLSTRLRYAWLRSRQANVSVEAAFDVQSDSQDVIFDGTTVPLSQDRLRVLRANSDGDYLAPWGGIMSGHFSTSFGLAGLGARSAAEALASGVPLSRQGANANFSKVEASVNYSQAVYREIFLSLNARAQYSFGQALLRSEQIGIASPAGLSTFDVGTLQGDSGYVLRAELSRSFELPTMLENIGFVATPYVFGAVGGVYLLDPTALENWSTTAAAYGIGLRLNDGVRGTRSFGLLSLEFGNQQRSDRTPTNTRFTVFFSQRF